MCMQLPFTTREEILEWEARYIEEQSEYRQSVEQTVIGFISRLLTSASLHVSST